MSRHVGGLIACFMLVAPARGDLRYEVANHPIGQNHSVPAIQHAPCRPPPLAGPPRIQAVTTESNFLEDSYARLEALAPDTVLAQAKTYFGGGERYSLDIDYARVARIPDAVGYRGYISLEFEGKEDPTTGVPKSLALLRRGLSQSITTR